MWGIIGPIAKAIAAGFAVWQQERALQNRPDMVKNHLDIARQKARDALNQADAMASNPNATPEQHAEALRAIRIADS